MDTTTRCLSLLDILSVNVGLFSESSIATISYGDYRSIVKLPTSLRNKPQIQVYSADLKTKGFSEYGKYIYIHYLGGLTLTEFFDTLHEVGHLLHMFDFGDVLREKNEVAAEMAAWMKAQSYLRFLRAEEFPDGESDIEKIWYRFSEYSTKAISSYIYAGGSVTFSPVF